MNKKTTLHALQGVIEIISDCIEEAVEISAEQFQYMEEQLDNRSTERKVSFLIDRVQDIGSNPFPQTLGNVITTCQYLLEEAGIDDPIERMKREVAYSLIFDDDIFHHRDKSNEEKYYALLGCAGIAAAEIKQTATAPEALARLGGAALTWLVLHLQED